MLANLLTLWALGLSPVVFAGPSFEAGRVIDTVLCKSDPTQSYALYIPAKGAGGALPVIYFFDPHGDGALPLKKYRSLAEADGFILIGSNNSKNGNDWQATGAVWRILYDDTRSRLKINGSRIYTAGFSGGAKVAGYVAIQHPGVRGVLANGAGLPDGVSAGDFPFSYTAITGEGDMNLTDLVGVDKEFDNSRTRHRLLVFDGKHEWAPLSTMDQAFAGLQFDAMLSGLISRNDLFINRYITESKGRIAAYARAGQLVRAGQECIVTSGLLDGLTPESRWFRQKKASLSGEPLYQQQLKAQAVLLVREENTKAEYMSRFQTADRTYWGKIISDLEEKAAGKTLGTGAGPTAEKGMYQRLLAYLSLAFYSLSNRLINSNENNGARHFVELYKLADPTNSEAWYFSALLNARDRHTAATENDLLKAVEVGFRDPRRLHQQREFALLSPPLDFTRIENRMKTRSN